MSDVFVDTQEEVMGEIVKSLGILKRLIEDNQLTAVTIKFEQNEREWDAVRFIVLAGVST